ncbi:MAG TPA: cytochrome c3 family protein, partial [Gemmataceae bacterium]|nr:cytochrome c3 family protein [Gemmataceae bacterium]
MSSSSATMRPRWRRWLFLLFPAAVTTALALLAVRWMLPKPLRPPASPFPLPSYSDSRYLNTKPGAEYVGAAVCAACHKDRHASYLLTAHSRSLSDLDPTTEPPDAAFVHQASGRSYRVYRQDGQLRHEEVLRSDDGNEVARVDLSVRYLIGSGHYCRSYLVEVDGFLHESPLTWYTAKQRWGLSPGYDFAQHWSFGRPIRVGCAACHAGRVEAADGSADRLILREKAIGCESCHGPGSIHTAFHRAGRTAPGAEDLTIVNPGKLPRALLEDVCAACHLNGPAAITVRGRRTGDYRPGMPLTDYRVDYRFDQGNEQMTVVGHMEQLRQSKCYQKSPDLSCLTCHDPHQSEKPKDWVAFYRRKCLDCHDSHPCRLDEAERRRKQPADDCSACHMPRSGTDIPHIAFTHHRIGLHSGP